PNRLVPRKHRLHVQPCLDGHDERLGSIKRDCQSQLAHHAPKQDNLFAVDWNARGEQEVRAGVESRSSLDPNDSVLPKYGIDVVYGAGNRELSLPHRNDLLENLLLHGFHTEGDEIGWSAHAGGIGTAHVAEFGVREVELRSAL